MASTTPDRREIAGSQEYLITDARAGVSPAQMVEKKLLALLGGVYAGGLRRGTGRAGDRQGHGDAREGTPEEPPAAAGHPDKSPAL